MTHATVTPLTVQCHITARESLSANVTRVGLQGPNTLRYQAGQYLEIFVEVEGEARWLPFSIANACSNDGFLELHIELSPSSASLAALALQLDTASVLTVRLPNGCCVLQEQDDRPLLLVAAATGMAQMKAIAEAALQQYPERQVDLWWGARTASDLYLDSALRQWANATPALSYFPVVEQAEEHDVEGVVARIDEALAQRIQQHNHYSIFLSGSPGMVYGVVDSLAKIEPMTEQVFSDVFSYAPR